MSYRQDIFKIPNLVSLIRILIAPLMIYLAIQQLENWFLAMLLFSGFTDVFDGFLARKLNQITTLGSHLDSWGDFSIYSAMAIGAWILWPDMVRREMLYFSLILISFLLPVLVGLVKFRRLTSYHTWSVKLAVLITFAGYVLLFADITNWPFMLASLLCTYAGIEQILITFVLREERVDVRSIWSALRIQQEANR